MARRSAHGVWGQVGGTSGAFAVALDLGEPLVRAALLLCLSAQPQLEGGVCVLRGGAAFGRHLFHLSAPAAWLLLSRLDADLPRTISSWKGASPLGASHHFSGVGEHPRLL